MTAALIMTFHRWGRGFICLQSHAIAYTNWNHTAVDNYIATASYIAFYELRYASPPVYTHLISESGHAQS